MEAKLRTKWVEALRSGEYEQCQGSLRESYADQKVAHCCLGVLCDIMNLSWNTPDSSDCSYGVDGDMYQNQGQLSHEMCHGIGLDYNIMEDLTDMNDGKSSMGGDEEIEQHSFEEIADFIEKMEV